jgi:hypothetical protein
MAEKIQIGDKWYVAATSARTEESPQVLKNDETFVMFDRFGDLQVLGPGDQGLYHEDTRYLSYQELLIDGARPLYLGATVKENNSLLVIELMNPDLTRGGEVVVAKGTVHIFRAKLLWQGACYEHIRLTNQASSRWRPRSRWPSTPISSTCSRCAAWRGSSAATFCRRAWAPATSSCATWAATRARAARGSSSARSRPR